MIPTEVVQSTDLTSPLQASMLTLVFAQDLTSETLQNGPPTAPELDMGGLSQRR